MAVRLSDMVCGELKLARADLCIDFDSANIIWTELCATWTFLVLFVLYKFVYYPSPYSLSVLLTLLPTAPFSISGSFSLITFGFFLVHQFPCRLYWEDSQGVDIEWGTGGKCS